LSIITPDGSKHALKLYGRGDNHGDSFYQYDPGGRASGCLANQTPIAGPLTYYTADNSYIKLVFPVAGGANWLNSAWTAYFADGTSASGIGTDNNSITDRHGNTVHVAKLTAWSTPTVVLSDDFQHTITMTYSSGTNTITQAGPAGSQLTWTVNYMSIPLNATYFCSTSQTQCTVSSSSGVASIQVPSPGAGPLTYSMTYNDSSVGGWGELRSVQLPSGAKVTYDYAYENGTGPAQRGPDRFNLLNNPVVKKAVDWTDESDGGAAARHEVTTYGYSYIGTAPSCSGCQTTVTTNPDGGSFTTNYYDPRVPSPLAGLVFQEKRPSGGTIERQWYQNRPFGSSASNTDEANAYIAAEVKSVATSGAATRCPDGDILYK